MRARLGDRATRRARERTSLSLRGHDLLPTVFDAAWYVARYRDVFWAGVDGLEHYIGAGLTEGRDPGPLVDLSFIRTQYSGPPLDDAGLLLALLDRGLASGWRPSPYVDLAWYSTVTPDAPADPVGSLRHLATVGLPAGARPSPFLDLADYSTRLPDIRSGRIHPFTYFTSLGQHLARFPHPAWDEAGYLDTNEYVRFALGMGKHLHGFEHFCAVGHAEVARGALLLPIRVGDRSFEYSEARYLAANPDVAAKVEEGLTPDGVTQFFAEGWQEVLSGARDLAPPATVARLIPSRQPSGQPAGRSLMLMVHHDPDSTFDAHVVTAVDAYQDADIEVQVISSGIDDLSRDLLEERDVRVHTRSHNDDLRDFGAWDLALKHLGPDRLSSYEKVVLSNDSAYFPVRDPASFLSAMHASAADVWSATDSFSGGRYHLQSYFLALGPRAAGLLLPELARRTAIHPQPTKHGLIQWFEIGLSQHAASHGLRLEAFCSVADLSDPASMMEPPDPRPLSSLATTVTNLTHHFWRTALARELPFLKVELLRDNPLDIDIEGWQTAIDGPCTADHIADHLARIDR